MTSDGYPERDGRPFFDLARDQLNEQLTRLDAIDTKIGMLFSTSTALLGILAAVLALKADGLTVASYAAVTISTFAYVWAVVWAWFGYRDQEWLAGPKLKQVYRLYTESSESDRQLEWLLANHIRLDYRDNEPAVADKLLALKRMSPALVIQTVTLVLTLVLVAA